jgi:predicted secreted protein
MRRFMPFLAAPLAFVIFACGAATVAPAGQTVTLVEKDAGRTVHVRTGDIVRVQLVESFPVPGSSLVWDVTSTDASVLAGVKTERTPQVRSGPGGSDTYTAFFKAGGEGQTLLNAHGATSCEAMAKPSCPDRNFTITVVVAG